MERTPLIEHRRIWLVVLSICFAVGVFRPLAADTLLRNGKTIESNVQILILGSKDDVLHVIFPDGNVQVFSTNDGYYKKEDDVLWYTPKEFEELEKRFCLLEREFKSSFLEWIPLAGRASRDPRLKGACAKYNDK